MDLADLAKRAMHADRKVSGSKDKGGAWIPWIELHLRRSMAVWWTAAVKWANTDGGAWYIRFSPMVLPKTMRQAIFLMKEALSIDCTLATPGVEAVARMKAR